jgi:heptosyltransferase-2
MALAAPQHWVAFCSATAWTTKQWPEERFHTVARQLKVAHPTLRILWLGLNRSTSLSADVCDEDGRGVSELPHLKKLLGRCSVLLCNDTGMMHLAEDQGVPVAAIFGPTTRELGFGPRLSQSQIIERPLWCRPCSKNGRMCHRFSDDKQACLKAVTVEDTLRVLTGMLTKLPSHDSLNLS